MKRFPLNQLEGARKVFSYTWSSDGIVFRCQVCGDQSCEERLLLEEWK